MKKIFERGDFTRYQVKSLNESMGDIDELRHDFAEIKTTVFISHKHDDLDELKGIIGFLEDKYNVKAYIDSQDPSLPKTTTGDTAKRIKERIDKCKKFILLATDGAIESKWCNWELGYGDAQKFNAKNIALLPVKDKGTYNSLYKGNEYMDIYPHIVYCDKNDSYDSGKKIPDGFYVRYKKDYSYYLIPLKQWFLQ